jgi:hypothetical protein
MARPKAMPANKPADDDDDFDPAAGAPAPPKAPNNHPVSPQPEVPGSQGTTPEAATEGIEPETKEPRNQGSETRLTSAERPKLGARVDPWLKQALKIAAAVESRTEETLVDQALTAYLYQHHPQITAEVKERHAR